MSRLRDLNKALKRYDSLLYAQETRPGRIDVMRKSQTGANPPHLIFALTDNWVPSGRPVEWSTTVIIERLKAHDCFRNDKIPQQIWDDLKKADEVKEKDQRNNMEAFLYDFAKQFQKATNDINTGSMDKIYREEGTHGYRKSGS